MHNLLQVRSDRNSALFVLAPFGVLLLAALGLFVATRWAAGGSWNWSLWPDRWLGGSDSASALAALSSAAEVVAAVLAIAITVVAIVVELAANRYTHRITQLFVRDPVNFTVMAFFVLTTLQCVWISVSAAAGDVAPRLPYGGLEITMAMVVLCLLALLPYFAYVSAFLHPLNVINHIRIHSFRRIKRSLNPRRRCREQITISIEELEDVALNAMEHRDRSISMASVDALAQLVRDYSSVRASFEDDWFSIDGSLARDPDFVSMGPEAREEIADHKLWFEMKILRQYYTIFVESLNSVRDVGYLVALNTRRIATMHCDSQPELCGLAIRFFNSYLRAAINAKDLRTAYYVLHHYRQLGEETLQSGNPGDTVRIANHLRFYGQLAFDNGLSFLLEVVAYDLSLIVEAAIERGDPSADALLEVLLRVDRQGDSSSQQQGLRGVRRAQVRLAAFLLERGELERAERVYADMACEDPDLLASVRAELLCEERPMYWEVTDRGVNFAYLPPERRHRVAEFFEIFSGAHEAVSH